MSIKNFKNPWAEGGEYYPKHLKGEEVLGVLNFEAKDENKTDKKSKYRVLLLGGVDVYNQGDYGSNRDLGNYIAKAALSKKYNIPLKAGDIKVVNSPLFSVDSMDGEDIFQDLLRLVKEDFDTSNGNLFLYGYSWGGQLLMEFLKRFEKEGILISLLITVDAAKGYFSFTVNDQVTKNVKYNLNLYQTQFYKGKAGSRGYPNFGTKVKNVDLTEERNKQGEEVIHSNIDEYTLPYLAQVVVNALNNDYNFYNFSAQEIKNQIKNYELQTITNDWIPKK